MAHHRFPRAHALGLIVAAALLASCAIVERQETKTTEQLLSAAGFSIRPADTPEKLASLQAMKQHMMIRRPAPDGTLQFTYADAAGCRCIYVGDEAAFQRYQRLAVERQIAIADQEAALDEEMDTPFPYGWWAVPYY
jgi:3-dehydroquinate synthetase